MSRINAARRKREASGGFLVVFLFIFQYRKLSNNATTMYNVEEK
jgi:hypothetical protein